MLTVKFTLTSRIPKASENLRKNCDATLGTHIEAAREQCVTLTPRSDNNETGHVHTQDTIRVEKVSDGRYKLRAGGAMQFIELGSMYRAPLAPMRTAIQMMLPELARDLRAMKVL
jgi:hypothetical protein